MPCAPGRPGLQHHCPIQVHQQGPGVLRLFCVRGHLLRRVYHAGPPGFRHPLPGVEQCGPGGLPGHGLWIYNCLRGDRPHTGVQRVQFQPWGDEQVQYENRLRCDGGSRASKGQALEGGGAAVVCGFGLDAKRNKDSR